LRVDDVNNRIVSGEGMYAIAIAEGTKSEDFSALMTDVHSKAMDAAVKGGVIIQEQADWMKSRGFGRGGTGKGGRPRFDSDENGQFGRGGVYCPGMTLGSWQQNP
jgi:hypothetical protein